MKCDGSSGKAASSAGSSQNVIVVNCQPQANGRIIGMKKPNLKMKTVYLMKRKMKMKKGKRKR
jgi:hypothetical protein